MSFTVISVNISIEYSFENNTLLSRAMFGSSYLVVNKNILKEIFGGKQEHF